MLNRKTLLGDKISLTMPETYGLTPPIWVLSLLVTFVGLFVSIMVRVVAFALPQKYAAQLVMLHRENQRYQTARLALAANVQL